MSSRIPAPRRIVPTFEFRSLFSTRMLSVVPSAVTERDAATMSAVTQSKFNALIKMTPRRKGKATAPMEIRKESFRVLKSW